MVTHTHHMDIFVQIVDDIILTPEPLGSAHGVALEQHF
jgi:hypothetical protein